MTKNTPARKLTGWHQIGIAVAAMGIIVLAGTGYYWLLIFGAGDSAGILWSRAGLLLAVPLVLGVAGIVVLFQRKRFGFWLVAAELAGILLISSSPTSMMGSALASQLIVACGLVLSVVGFFRSKGR